MHIQSVKNRNSPPCILLRESYREDGKVKKRTVANITDWPPELIAGFSELLKNHRKGGGLAGSADFQIIRSLPHGHVRAVLGMVRTLKLDKILLSRSCPNRELVLAMIVSRILHPSSKLATTRCLNQATAASSLAGELGLEDSVHENELYSAMDWLLSRQDDIEKKLAARHLAEGSLVLYDLTSSYFEGKTCPLARRGYSRDGKRGSLQIVYGMLCDARGCPVAVEVFEGNTADPGTLSSQVQKLRERFKLKRVVLVGDRGMITQKRIDEELRDIEGLDWISALRSSQISSLVNQGAIQLELFDEQNLAEIQSPDFPGERLVVCRNPALAERRSRKRESMLAATEAELELIAAAVARPKRTLKGKDKIGLRVGRVLNARKMAKHFLLEIGEDCFSWRRNEESIEAEARLDGLYVVRSSLDEQTGLGPEDLVERYKDLSSVENAFRSIKTVDLRVRPIYHRDADRVRAHILLCMLSYYVEWHMRQALKPLLFDDDDPEASRTQRADVVAPKEPSSSAKAKARVKTTPADDPVHSFQTMLKDLGTLCRNTIKPNIQGAKTWTQDTEPTSLQKKIFTLLSKYSPM